MSIAAVGPVTLEEFLRLEAEAPDDVSLELIDGEIVEGPMTTRSPKHCRSLSRIAHELLNWLDSQSAVVGAVDTGDVRCRIRRDPDRVVGIDIGVWLGDEFVEPPTDPPLYDAPPTVAIEVVSPSDTHENVFDKVWLYLNADVPQVWVVDPDFETVTIHRRDEEPQFFSSRQTLTAEPELPGFKVPVSYLFHSRNSSTASR